MVQAASGIKVIPDGTTVTQTSAVTYQVTDCPTTITVGDTFVAYFDGLPNSFTASRVTTLGNVTTITVSQVGVESAFSNIDCEGVTHIDLSADEFSTVGTMSVQSLSAQSIQFPSFTVTPGADGRSLTAKASAGVKGDTANGYVDASVSLSNLDLNYNVKSNTAVVYVSGNMDARIGIGGSWNVTVPIKTIPIAGVGSVKLELIQKLNGEAYAGMGATFKAGFQVDTGGDVRLIKEFNKKTPTIRAMVQLTQDLKLSANINLAVAKGSVWAKIGTYTKAEVVSYASGTPKTCASISQCLTASAGAEASINLVVWKKEWSKVLTIWDMSNSPVKMYFHYEDGKLVDSCTRNATTSSGATGRSSKTAYNYGGGSVLDDYSASVYSTTHHISDSLTLTNDLAIVGDLYVAGGYINLNGHRLIVSGNLIHSSGTVELAKGELSVAGDYRLQSVSTNSGGDREYGASSGYLKMICIGDKVTVSGNMYFNPSNSHGSTLLNDGILSVEGNFSDYSGRFNPAGSHLAILNGQGYQSIALKSGSKFNRLQLIKDKAFYSFNPDDCWNELVLPDFIDPRFKPSVTAAILSPQSATLGPGDSQDFKAIVFGLNGITQEITWSLSGQESNNTAISSAGKLIIGEDESADEITILATPTSDPSKVGRATVTVKRVDVSLAVTKVTLTAGSTYTFNATVYGTNGVSQNVAWSLAGAKSSGTSISTQGVLTVAEDEPSGTLTVTATSVDDPTGTAEVAVTVKGQASNDEKAAEAITVQIAAIPATGSLTLEDAATVVAARTAYNSLTDEQKALVPDETLAALVSAEAKIKELQDAADKAQADAAAASGVTQMITALPPTSDIKLSDEAAVTAARSAYNALTADQKALVSAETLDALAAAEAEIQELKDASGTGGSGEGGNTGGGTGTGGDTGTGGTGGDNTGGGTEAPKPLTVSAENARFTYDGKAHGGVTANASDPAATVSYGVREGEYAYDKCPEFTDAGTHVVYVMARRPKATASVSTQSLGLVAYSPGRTYAAASTPLTTAATDDAYDYAYTSATVTIDRRTVEDATVALSASKFTYDGKAHEPAATVVVGGITLAPGTDYEISYKDNTNVGTATVSVTGKGNYTGSKSATFEIAKAEAEPSGQNPTSPTEKPGSGTDGSGNPGTQPGGNNGKGLSTGKTATAGVGATAVSYTATSADTVTYASVASKGAKNITVPDTVAINGKTYKVTKVADNAFSGSSATSIVIGANVTTVTAKTFAGVNKAKTITLGKSVKKVAAKSFAKNKSLRTLNVKTTKLAKKSAMKNCLKGSKVTKIQVKVGTKAQNKKHVKKYKKLFAVKKPASGKKVSVK